MTVNFQVLLLGSMILPGFTVASDHLWDSKTIFLDNNPTFYCPTISEHVLRMTDKMRNAVEKKHNQIREVVSRGDCFHQPSGDIEPLVRK